LLLMRSTRLSPRSRPSSSVSSLVSSVLLATTSSRTPSCPTHSRSSPVSAALQSLPQSFPSSWLPSCSSYGRSFTALWLLWVPVSSAWVLSALVSTRSSTVCSFPSVCTTHSSPYSGLPPSASTTSVSSGLALPLLPTATASVCTCPASSPA